MKKTKRFWAALLALAMCLAMLPSGALAAEEPDPSAMTREELAALDTTTAAPERSTISKSAPIPSSLAEPLPATCCAIENETKTGPEEFPGPVPFLFESVRLCVDTMGALLTEGFFALARAGGL